MLRALRFSTLSLVRQPARSLLGIFGLTAIGALLFDMLLLSRGLVISFGDLLARSGFDVRVLASDAPPFAGPPITGATALARDIGLLPGIDAVLQLRVRDADVVPGPQSAPEARAGTTGGGIGTEARRVEFIGADPQVTPMWTVVDGEGLPVAAGAPPAIVVNRELARRLRLRPGSAVVLRGRCADGSDALPPVRFTVAGIAEFPFDSATSFTAAGTLRDANTLCAERDQDRAEMLLVRSKPRVGALAAAAEIRAAHPELYAVTNDELVERFSRVEFSYFRQISTVLATVTIFFGFLLVTVLLTVSVNQRLVEIAALRAIGLSRLRVAAGVVWESIVLVGIGGAAAIPIGAALSVWLDGILRSLPGLPAGLRFFVFEGRALAIYAGLLAIASVGAAGYPVRIVSRLPIAATLRREVVS